MTFHPFQQHQLLPGDLSCHERPAHLNTNNLRSGVCSTSTMDHATLVFASVFPVPSLSHTTPTPVATPDLGHTAPGSSFGGPFIGNAGGAQHRAVKRTQAWSTATRFLSLPNNPGSGTRRSQRSADVEGALYYLLVGEGKSEEGEKGLLEWYTNEARLHFASFVKPALKELWEKVLYRKA